MNFLKRFFSKKESVESKIPIEEEKPDDGFVRFSLARGEREDDDDIPSKQAAIQRVQAKAPGSEFYGMIAKGHGSVAMDGDIVSGTAQDDAISAMNAGLGQFNPVMAAFFAEGSFFIGYQNMAFMAQHWLIAKACGMKSKDAVKKWFEISRNDGKKLDSEQKKYIEDANRNYGLKSNLVEADFFRNVFGIRAILFKHVNPDFDYSKPFRKEDFLNGGYAGMSQIDPYWMIPEISGENMTDPTSINFKEPSSWFINGKEYHSSHFVILKGDSVPDYLKSVYRYGGISLTQKMYERVYATETVANEIPALLKTKRTSFRKVDLDKAQANKRQFKKNLELSNETKDNYQVNIIGTGEDAMQFDTQVSGIGDLLTSEQEMCASIVGIPVSLLFGAGHNGFSTGNTDMDYYISEVESLQGGDLERIINAHYDRLTPSHLVPTRTVEDISVRLDTTWNPIKPLDAKDIAQIRLTNAQADAALYGTGAVDSGDISKRLNEDEFSGYGGLTDEMDLDDADLEQDEYTDSTAAGTSQDESIESVIGSILDEY